MDVRRDGRIDPNYRKKIAFKNLRKTEGTQRNV